MEPLLDKLARQKKVVRFIAGVIKFVFAMIVMTIVCTWAWEALLDGKVYNCTDGPACYLTPGDWVHSWEGHPVKVVQQVVPSGDMSESDTLKAGWSVAGLWCIWILFFGASLLVSIMFARVPWIATLERLGETRHEHKPAA